MLHGLILFVISLSIMLAPNSVRSFCIDKQQMIQRFEHVPGSDENEQVIKKSFALANDPLNGRMTVLTDPLSLQKAAQDTLRYMKKYAKTHAKLFGSPAFANYVISSQKAQETLDYLVRIIEEDRKTGFLEFVILPF
ncbi:hypothetical protein IPF37_03685 [bacterium]|nr:MAG: hypothetical protein IPF37_03685 [bacterium]